MNQSDLLAAPEKAMNLTYEIKFTDPKSPHTYVTNLKVVGVRERNEIYALLRTAQQHRAVAATSRNEASSRSHSIFRMVLSGSHANTGTHTQDEKLPPKWPRCGSVEFKDVSLHYDDAKPPVLRNLNFSVASGEKIGIVGRTGAGKSSLISCLFRLKEPKGTIIVDGADIGKLGLHTLRKKISSIPQDPTLFNDTLRKNLDPFAEHSDEQLWQALEEVQLKDAVQESPGGLEHVVSEGGSNLSVGQRQLVCLARAILSDNPILLMDEATANVDPKTDELIQRTIRQKFVTCTVLTVAHRLHTIMDSTRVMVLSAGRLIEFNAPYVLLKDKNSLFSELVQQSGAATASHLRNLALSAFTQSRNGNADKKVSSSFFSGKSHPSVVLSSDISKDSSMSPESLPYNLASEEISSRKDDENSTPKLRGKDLDPSSTNNGKSANPKIAPNSCDLEPKSEGKDSDVVLSRDEHPVESKSDSECGKSSSENSIVTMKLENYDSSFCDSIEELTKF